MSIRRIGFGMALAILAGVSALGAKPPSGGGGDTSPPGPIQNLYSEAAARGVTLRFVAPGDDANTGTAAGYDVFYQQGACPSSPNNPSTWTLAPRSAETMAVPAGSIDFFNVRSADGDGLEAGTPYCIAIRARDEVPKFGPFSTVDVTTAGVAGDWPLWPRYVQPLQASEPSARTSRIRLLPANRYSGGSIGISLRRPTGQWSSKARIGTRLCRHRQSVAWIHFEWRPTQTGLAASAPYSAAVSRALERMRTSSTTC